MHKLAVLLTLTIALVSTARAQGAPPPPPASNWLFGPRPAPPGTGTQKADSVERPDVVPELFKGITLSPAQAATIDSIRERYIIQYQVFTPGVRPDSATRQRVRALVRQELADARAVLTLEQQPQWDLNVADVLALLASGMPELFPTVAKADVSTPVLSGSSPLLNSLLQGIALTPDQRVKVDSIRASYGRQAPVVALGTQPDSATVRQIRDLSRQTLDGIRLLLTPQQQQVWDRNLTQALTSNMRVGSP
jgi:hypothetical protein